MTQGRPRPIAARTGRRPFCTVTSTTVSNPWAAGWPFHLRLDGVALHREPGSRGLEPAPIARPRRDGPLLRRAARRPRCGRGGPPLRGALHPQLPRRLRGDAAPLPAAAAGGALDVPAARDRPQRHRHLLRRRLYEPGDLQPHVPGDRRRGAVELSRGEWTDGGSELLPDVGDAAGGGGGGGAAIEQFWRRRRSDGLLA